MQRDRFCYGLLGPTRKNIVVGSVTAISPGDPGDPFPKKFLALSTPSWTGFSPHAIVLILSLLSSLQSALAAPSMPERSDEGRQEYACNQFPFTAGTVEEKYISLPLVNLMPHTSHLIYPGGFHPASRKSFMSVCSNAHRSGSSLPQTTTVTRCPAKGFRALMNVFSTFLSNRHLGPWRRSSCSRLANCLDALPMRIVSASACIATSPAFWGDSNPRPPHCERGKI
jgi:hypothetical protein